MFSCDPGKICLINIFVICLLYVRHYHCYHIRTNYLLKSHHHIKQQQNKNNKNQNKLIFYEYNKFNLLSLYATTNIISPFDSSR